MMIGAPLSAPIVEETTKGIGIVLLFWLLRGEFDNVRDGFIYGALIGAGFNWFESALYVQQNFVEFGTAPYGFQIGTRFAWLGLAGHALFSGIFGASLGVSRATSKLWLRVLAPVGGLRARDPRAMPGTTRCRCSSRWPPPRPARPRRPKCSPRRRSASGKRCSAASLTNLVVFLPFALLLAAIIYRSGKAERRVILEELAGRGRRAASPPAEFAAIAADRIFRTRRIDPRHAQVSAALVNAQNELAFRKRRLQGSRASTRRWTACSSSAGRRLRHCDSSCRDDGVERDQFAAITYSARAAPETHIAACRNDPREPSMFKSRNALLTSSPPLPASRFPRRPPTRVFTAAMDGAQSLPEPIKTPATGTVELRLSADGKTIALQDHGRQAHESVAGRPAFRRREPERPARGQAVAQGRRGGQARRVQRRAGGRLVRRRRLHRPDGRARRCPTWSTSCAPATPTSTCTPTTAWTRPYSGPGRLPRRRDPRPAEVNPASARLGGPGPAGPARPIGTPIRQRRRFYWPASGPNPGQCRPSEASIPLPTGQPSENTQCR